MKNISEIYINGQKSPFQTEFTENGKYHLKIIIKDPQKFQSPLRMFYECSSLVKASFKNFKQPYLTNMEGIFKCCLNLESIDLDINTTNVTNMSELFQYCPKLKSINGLNKFNTENVIDMSKFCYCCGSLESIDLSSFKFTNVKKIEAMFYFCKLLKTIEVSDDLRVNKGTDFNNIFTSCDLLSNEIRNKFRPENLEDDNIWMMSSDYRNINCNIY